MTTTFKAAAVLGLAALCLWAGAPAPAAGASDQGACFCVKPTSNAFQPYIIIKYSTAGRCAAMNYAPSGAPWDSGIPSCDVAWPVPPTARITPRRCYCQKPTNNPFQPYQVISYPTLPQCSSVKPPAGHGFHEELLSCDDMRDCARIAGNCNRSIAKLQKALAAAVAKMLTCKNNECLERVQTEINMQSALLGAMAKRCGETDRVCFGTPAGSPH